MEVTRAGDGLVEHAIHLAGSGRIQEAVTRCQSLLVDDPENIAAADILAQILLEIGQADAALKVMDVITRRFPGDPDLWLRKFDVGAAANRSDVVNDASRKMLMLSPHDIKGNELRRNYLDWSGDVNAAEVQALRVCLITPGSADAWYQAGSAYERRRRFDRSVTFLRRAALLDPAHLKALCDLSQILCQISAVSPTQHRTWLASGVLEPSNTSVWSRLISIEFATHGRITETETMLRGAPEATQRSHGVRRSLARGVFREGRTEDARQCMLQIYSELDDNDAPDGALITGDNALFDYLMHLLHAGHFTEVFQRIQAVKTINAESNLQFFTLAHVARVASAPIMPPPLAPNGTSRLYVSVPVWGSGHTKLWSEAGLPSLVDELTAPLFENFDVTVHIFTTSASRERIETLAAMARLKNLAHVVFLDFDPLMESGHRSRNYLGMLVAHWATMMLGRRDGAGALVLVADYIFGRESLGNLGRILVGDQFDALYSEDLWIAEKGWDVLVDQARYPGGPSTAPMADLVDLFRTHTSSRIKFQEIGCGQGSIPSDPARMFLVHDNGYELRTIQPQLLYASAELLQRIWVSSLSATDNGFADWALMALGDTSRMGILTDPQEFVCATVEIDEEARAALGHYPQRLKTDNIAGELIAQFGRGQLLSKARFWALHQKLIIGDCPDTSIIDEVVGLLPEASIDFEQEFARRVGIPAFDYSRRRGDN